MSKAILVMDMPENCNDCKLCYYSDGRVQLCYWYDKVINEAKPDWCPLKPMPEEYPECEVSDYWVGYDSGYNACIDEILKR